MNEPRCWTAADEDATIELGQALGSVLGTGDFVALHGPLGAGKTTFCRGLARGLGVVDPVSSPTYLLCHEYSGPVPLLHLDAYFRERLEGQLLDGLAERIGREGVAVAEWAENLVGWLPEDRLEVRFEVEGEGRRLGFTATGPRSKARLEALGERLGASARSAAHPDRGLDS